MTSLILVFNNISISTAKDAEKDKNAMPKFDYLITIESIKDYLHSSEETKDDGFANRGVNPDLFYDPY